MCKININEELNGIELSFESKPDRATLDSIKAQGFKWNGRKMVWYAKQTADRLTFAQTLGQIETATTRPAGINLDNLGENCPASFWGDGGLSKAIREDLKRRGVKGCTVRQNSSGYTPAITVTVKATADDFASVEEAAKRYTFHDWYYRTINHGTPTGHGFKWLYLADVEKMSEEEKQTAYNNFLKFQISEVSTFGRRDDRNTMFELTTDFYDKCKSIAAIANQWNHDNSDPMTDYFDVGYYLDIDIKHPDEFEPREEMTEAERNAYAEELKQKEAEEEREAAEREAEAIRREEERAKYDAWHAAAVERINDSVIINDLDESEQLYITGLVGGIGKEATLEELNETIKERTSPAALDAVITRLITINDPVAWDNFNKLYLTDFDFIAGKGGTGSEDVRLSDIDSIYKLSEGQRETVKFFNNDCVGVIYNNNLELVIDPSGHNYARNVYKLTENSEQKPAAAVLEDLRRESEQLPPFYFPLPVEEQAAQLHEGQEITVYQCDGWILNNIYAGSGIVTGWYMGKYAQYEGLFIELLNGKKTSSVFIRNNHDCIIYEGIKNTLPQDVTSKQAGENMRLMYNYDELIPNVYNYYKTLGQMPIIDTCYR